MRSLFSIVINPLEDVWKILIGIHFFVNCVWLFKKNYGSRSKKGEFLRFELSHNALNRKPQK